MFSIFLYLLLYSLSDKVSRIKKSNEIFACLWVMKNFDWQVSQIYHNHNILFFIYFLFSLIFFLKWKILYAFFLTTILLIFLITSNFLCLFLFYFYFFLLFLLLLVYFMYALIWIWLYCLSDTYLLIIYCNTLHKPKAKFLFLLFLNRYIADNFGKYRATILLARKRAGRKLLTQEVLNFISYLTELIIVKYLYLSLNIYYMTVQQVFFTRIFLEVSLECYSF